jgi:hypothetical protein
METSRTSRLEIFPARAEPLIDSVPARKRSVATVRYTHQHLLDSVGAPVLRTSSASTGERSEFT